MALIFLQPVGDVLQVHGPVFHLNRLFDGNDVHAYSTASGRNHLRDPGKRKVCHALEEHGKLRVTVHEGRVHVCVLS